MALILYLDEQLEHQALIIPTGTAEVLSMEFSPHLLPDTEDKYYIEPRTMSAVSLLKLKNVNVDCVTTGLEGVYDIRLYGDGFSLARYTDRGNFNECTACYAAGTRVSWGGNGGGKLGAVTFTWDGVEYTALVSASGGDYQVPWFAISSNCIGAKSKADEPDDWDGGGSTWDRNAGKGGSGDLKGDQVTGSAQLAGNLIPFENSTSGRTGFHLYHLTPTGLSEFNTALYIPSSKVARSATSESISDILKDAGQTLWANWKNYAFNPIEGVLGVHALPYQLTLGADGWEEEISPVLQLAGTAIPITSSHLSVVKNSITSYTFPTLNLAETFGDFNDYSDCTVRVYLPFCGMLDLPPSGCMNGAIIIKYFCDVSTGDVCARVYGVNRFGYFNLLGSAMGNAATSVPVAHSNDNTMKILAGAASGAVQAVGSAFTGNIPGVVNGALQANPLMMAAKYENHTGIMGNLSGKAGVINLTPYVEIIQNIPVHAQDEFNIRGIPVYSGGTVEQGTFQYQYGDEFYTETVNYSGFTSYQSVDLSGVSTATDAQKAEIERLLKEGVYV